MVSPSNKVEQNNGSGFIPGQEWLKPTKEEEAQHLKILKGLKDIQKGPGAGPSAWDYLDVLDPAKDGSAVKWVKGQYSGPEAGKKLWDRAVTRLSKALSLAGKAKTADERAMIRGRVYLWYANLLHLIKSNDLAEYRSLQNFGRLLSFGKATSLPKDLSVLLDKIGSSTDLNEASLNLYARAEQEFAGISAKTFDEYGPKVISGKKYNVDNAYLKCERAMASKGLGECIYTAGVEKYYMPGKTAEVLDVFFAAEGRINNAIDRYRNLFDLKNKKSPKFTPASQLFMATEDAFADTLISLADIIVTIAGETLGDLKEPERLCADAREKCRTHRTAFHLLATKSKIVSAKMSAELYAENIRRAKEDESGIDSVIDTLNRRMLNIKE